MPRVLSCLLILTLISSINASEKIPTYVDPIAGEYFKDWLLCGPFPNPLPEAITEYLHDQTSLGFFIDYLKAAGGERGVRPFDGMQIVHPNGKKLVWRRFHGFFPLIDLDAEFEPNDQVIAYAACLVKSSSNKKMIMSVTSNDGVKVWQNGEVVLDHLTGGTEEPDRDFVPVVLAKGDNYFLVKVEEGFGKWSFQFRLLDFDKTKQQVNERIYLLSRPDVEETADGWEIFIGQRHHVEIGSEKVPALVQILDVDGRRVMAEFNTFIGETLSLRRSDLALLPGVHPVLCHVNQTDGSRHTLQSIISIDPLPTIDRIKALIEKAPAVNTETSAGRVVALVRECLTFHIDEDLHRGNILPMALTSKWQVAQRFSKWCEKLNNSPSIYHLVLPRLRQIEISSKTCFNITAETVLVDLSSGACRADLARFQETVSEKLSRRLEQQAHRPSSGTTIVVGELSNFKELISVSDFPNTEAYRIDVTPDQVTVVGASAAGLHNALITLRLLAEMDLAWPSATIIDFPANAARCAFMYVPPKMDQDIRDRLYSFIDLKYNQIVVGSGNYYRLNDENVVAGLKEYYEFLRAYHVEPIPTVWLGGKKDWWEGIHLQNEPITFDKNQIELEFERLLDIPSSQPRLRSQADGGIVFVRGRDYEIQSVEPPKIRRLEDGRIKKGSTVFLEGDLVDRRVHRFIKPCPSEDEVYAAFDIAVASTIHYFNPKLIHINHDEIGVMNGDSRCQKRGMTDVELLAYQITRAYKIIKGHDPRVDIIMWADSVNPYHNAGKKRLEKTCDMIPRDIIMAHWFYDASMPEHLDCVSMGTKFFLDKGFRVYGCPWDDMANNQLWERVVNSHHFNPACLGFMHTQWSGRINGFAQTALSNWSGTTWLTQ